MAGEAKNLLTRTLATAADDSMQLYVVHNGRDYRILLSTLLSLLTKARLGLEHVNNTSDADKPLSSAAVQALDTKANLGDVVSREEWNLFIQQIGDLITPAELAAIVDQIQTALQSKVSAETMQLEIAAALAPVNTAIESIQAELTSLSAQAAGYATTVALNEAIAFVQGEITTLNDAFEAYKIANDARVAALETRVATLEENQLVFGPNFW